MKPLAWVGVLVVGLTSAATAHANVIPRPFKLDRVNRELHGQLVDYTRNHGADRRIWSPALQQWRDLYVYLPPGYCPEKRYPLVFILHGFSQDETSFLQYAVRPLDKAIATGRLPPCIVVAPDGSLRGMDCLFNVGTFFLNSNAGRFEDFLMQDVYQFILTTYPIRPEPEAHFLLGVSMGGGVAYTQTIKHPDKFRTAAAIFPPLNLRWISCRGRYMDNFDPACWGWREDFSRGHETIGRFYGIFGIPLRKLIYPLYDRTSPDLPWLVSQVNPIEMLDHYDVRPGQFQFYVAYGGKDEFNLDAQIESFLYRAREKGLEVAVDYDPKGRHNVATALRFLPHLVDWLRPRMEPWAPPR
jgi:S-formylglutathione hydrolase FrmB